MYKDPFTLRIYVCMHVPVRLHQIVTLCLCGCCVQNPFFVYFDAGVNEALLLDGGGAGAPAAGMHSNTL